MSYKSPMHYSPEELDAAALCDLEIDAIQSEHQAKEGPFYPERGITKKMLLNYAKKCRDKITKYKKGGAHKAIMAGE